MTRATPATAIWGPGLSECGWHAIHFPGTVAYFAIDTRNLLRVFISGLSRWSLVSLART